MAKENIKQALFRDPSVDATKGLLILMVVVHHVVDVGARELPNGNELLLFVENIQRPLILCYFMQAFFIITGMCSNFDKPFKPFILNQVRSLLIPALTFTIILGAFHFSGMGDIKHIVWQLLFYLGNFWFITSLFMAKVIFYVLHRYILSKRVIIVVLLAISLFGVFLNDVEQYPNFYYHRHTLVLIASIGIGAELKEYLKSKRVLLASLFLYPVLIMLSYVLFDSKIPYLTYGFGITMVTWPIYIILSTTGTVIITKIGALLMNNSILKLCGKNSLLIYIFNSEILESVIGAYSGTLSNCNFSTSVILYAFFVIITTATGIYISYLFNHTKLRVFLGKF